jgi:ABC-type amino acid transport substrate-binding protein
MRRCTVRSGSWLLRTIFIFFALSLFAACSKPPPVTVVQLPPLRVGVVRDYPPLVFRVNDSFSGAEAEMARLLGRALSRPVQFVQRGFDDQIPALLAGETDIIMTGMVITDARKVRINFSDYYLKSSLAVACRASDAGQFNSMENILGNAGTVGVIGSTVAEAYVRRTFPGTIRVILLGKPSDAPFELKNRRIDVYVDDAPSIAWIASSNASEVRGLFEPMTTAYYGWGVSKDDDVLLGQVNGLLSQWKKDGTLDRVLRRWLPYLKSYY